MDTEMSKRNTLRGKRGGWGGVAGGLRRGSWGGTRDWSGPGWVRAGQTGGGGRSGATKKADILFSAGLAEELAEACAALQLQVDELVHQQQGAGQTGQTGL